ncbi:MAG: alpha amylase C-terminal domain-containing protein, partial [Defluviitaleaceae bacterium]|nr:alpha amylase C-terminal domain-containing protein [Defluviitaleaceae bacterium]
RAAYGFMMGHPGKKLLFMGGEFAQFEEWSEAKALNWFLLDEYDHHRKMLDFVRDLNRLYLNEPALWQQDFAPGGFGWINCDDNERSIISFYRVGEKKCCCDEGQEMICQGFDYIVFICNFTPIPCVDYRVGLPVSGKYTELLNSDSKIYGGGGIANPGMLESEEILCDGKHHSLAIKLPPLGVVVLKLK